jgi:hypothetical protein
VRLKNQLGPQRCGRVLFRLGIHPEILLGQFLTLQQLVSPSHFQKLTRVAFSGNTASTDRKSQTKPG